MQFIWIEEHCNQKVIVKSNQKYCSIPFHITWSCLCQQRAVWALLLAMVLLGTYLKEANSFNSSNETELPFHIPIPAFDYYSTSIDSHKPRAIITIELVAKNSSQKSFNYWNVLWHRAVGAGQSNKVTQLECCVTKLATTGLPHTLPCSSAFRCGAIDGM